VPSKSLLDRLFPKSLPLPQSYHWDSLFSVSDSSSVLTALPSSPVTSIIPSQMSRAGTQNTGQVPFKVCRLSTQRLEDMPKITLHS
jgi:hypothetical protein